MVDPVHFKLSKTNANSITLMTPLSTFVERFILIESVFPELISMKKISVYINPSRFYHLSSFNFFPIFRHSINQLKSTKLRRALQKSRPLLEAVTVRRPMRPVKVAQAARIATTVAIGRGLGCAAVGWTALLIGCREDSMPKFGLFWKIAGEFKFEVGRLTLF